MAIPKPKKPSIKSKPPIPTEARQFSIEPWGANEGKRIIIYGDTGLGKTTLSATAGKTVFLPLGEGGQVLHPITGERLDCINNLKTFSDVRNALQQYDLYKDVDTVVIDNVTLLQDLAEPYVVATIPTDKGARVQNILGYGYNKGFKHLYNVMKSVLVDCDELIRRGKNVILIAQAALHNVPNPSGEDFIRAGLRLHVDKTWNIESLYCEWADYVFRIDYLNAFVKDKKVTGNSERAVFVQPELYFRAKSRTPWYNDEGELIRTLAFENPADRTTWQFVLGAQ